ncbi:MAG: PKD domain-containing protein [Cytophagales bacterium]|nr:PKD domain-containing protein [Cytophagales bacterium]
MRKFKLMLSGMLSVACLVAVLFMSACEDDPTPPTASFTYEADGREVTFTNTSSNGSTFLWTFGDGSTSTEKDPVHTYSVYGDYTVTLEVKGDGGSKLSLPDVITLAKSSAVVIDGNFAEWVNVPEVVAPEKFGSITKVKVDYDALKIYFYVEGTAGPGGPGATAGGLNGFFDVYLNTDNNPATGYFSGWYPEGYGADYLIEGDFSVMRDAELFKHKSTALVTEFLFDKVGEIGANIIKSSNFATVGSGKGIEFSISRAAFTNLASKLTFAVVDVDGNYYFAAGGAQEKSRNYTETWATLGTFPKDNTATGKLLEIDLTK